MGAIKLATSNSTDEEYGGTFPLDASDIPYDANTSVKQKIDEVDGKKISITELLNQLNISSTPTSYNCNWAVYDALIVENIFYGNVMASATVPTSYFNGTSSGNNIQLAVPGITIRTAVVYKNDNTHIYARQLNPDSAWGVRIYGMKLA